MWPPIAALLNNRNDDVQARYTQQRSSLEKVDSAAAASMVDAGVLGALSRVLRSLNAEYDSSTVTYACQTLMRILVAGNGTHDKAVFGGDRAPIARGGAVDIGAGCTNRGGFGARGSESADGRRCISTKFPKPDFLRCCSRSLGRLACATWTASRSS